MRIPAILTTLTLLTLAACGDKSPTESNWQPAYDCSAQASNGNPTFCDFVQFNQLGYILGKHRNSLHTDIYQEMCASAGPAVVGVTRTFSWEDRNSNGAFEPGIDSPMLQSGYPFADFDEDGLYDGVADYEYVMLKWTRRYGIDYASMSLAPQQKAYEVTVADGRQFYLPAVPFEWSAAFDSISFTLRNEGLYVSGFGGIGENSLLLLDTGVIVAVDSLQVTQELLNDSTADSIRYRQWVSTSESLTVGGIVYDDLLHLKLRGEKTTLVGETVVVQNWLWHFYFQEDEGLLAIIGRDTNGPVHEYYFDKKYDKIPLPMTLAP